MYLCMYLCARACMYLCMYLCARACMSVCACICVRAPACLCVHFVCVCVCVCVQSPSPTCSIYVMLTCQDQEHWKADTRSTLRDGRYVCVCVCVCVCVWTVCFPGLATPDEHNIREVCWHLSLSCWPRCSVRTCVTTSVSHASVHQIRQEQEGGI